MRDENDPQVPAQRPSSVQTKVSIRLDSLLYLSPQCLR